MKKNQVKEIYKKKVNLLKKYDEAYFNQDNPIVSDKNYDFLKIEILKLEKKFFFLKDLNSPSKNWLLAFWKI